MLLSLSKNDTSSQLYIYMYTMFTICTFVPQWYVHMHGKTLIPSGLMMMIPCVCVCVCVCAGVGGCSTLNLFIICKVKLLWNFEFSLNWMYCYFFFSSFWLTHKSCALLERGRGSILNLFKTRKVELLYKSWILTEFFYFWQGLHMWEKCQALPSVRSF